MDDIRWGRVKADIHVHKKQFLNPDGTPKMRKKYSWSDEMVPDLDETDIDIGKIQSGRIPYLHAYQWFSSLSLIDKRPPATVSVYCKNPEDVAHLCHCKVEDLPLAIRYMSYAMAFCDRHAKIDTNVHLIYNKSDFKREFPNNA